MSDDRAAVRAWHRAVNDRDLDAAGRIAAPGIRVGGPKGRAEGVDVFLDWIAHAGIRLEPVAWHPVGPGRVVVEQDARWPDRPDADTGGQPVRTATLFTVDGGRVVEALRFDDGVGAALRAAWEGGG
ncbi:nuclear transport factor 2 family protein [Streptomonospora sp. PA3]|uniref:nuclear transport factor 2 family protein n=1 Tax=Streptomonospora sp. PA3 TaxID=2607326 RepID=UPI0013064B33|nr:nuclear transport factor 2 family protein [Streptomonospora sp. PA3]